MSHPNEAFLHEANLRILERGEVGAIGEVFSEEFVSYTGDRELQGQDAVRRFVQRLRKCLPDLELVSLEVLATAEDRITWRRCLRGTHAVAMLGIPASGRQVRWHDMLVSRIEGGRIVEEWATSELAGALMLALKKE